jgi:serine phosphatase RsbU (regulator of sigma subunit)
MRLLLAEDSAASRLLLQRAVEGLGHECVVAGDGLAAWEAFQGSDVEVVISDWLMPGIDGDELCRRIRADPDAPYSYFIMLTSLEDKGHVLRGMQAGVDDFLSKPLDPQELQMRLIAASRVTALHRRLRRQQQEIENELELAAHIQASLLPDEPPGVDGVSVAGRCFPAANVGGDCFDYVRDDEGRLVVAIADVAGHSIGSALLMAMARSTLRREIAAGAPPADVLAATNRSLYGDLVTAELFITMFCARLDPASGLFEYANAGHNPPLLRTGETVRELDAEGAAIGLLPDVEFENATLRLGPGDEVLLYTDGATEALDSAQQQFGEQRLHELVASANGAAPAALIDRIYAAVRAHSEDAPQQDDITLVAQRRDAP